MQSDFQFGPAERDAVADRPWLRKKESDSDDNNQMDTEPGFLLAGTQRENGRRNIGESSTDTQKATAETRREAHAAQTPSKSTQQARILKLLESGEWVGLPRILELRIAQFGARIKELRDRYGYNIVNRRFKVGDVTHSEYRLVRE